MPLGIVRTSVGSWQYIGEREMTRPLSEILSPSSVAVIGASRDPRKVGYAALRNIVNSNFQGTVVPVNPKADEILGLQCFPRISDYEGAIELAVVAIPAEEVAEVVEECGRRGVRGVVVMSAGFREEGPRGAERERMLLDVCRRYQMRLLGPNCFGVINTAFNFNASFAKRKPLRGKIAFISQSGALCAAILDWSLTEEVGFSSFVSLGNKADLDETDFIEALAADEETRVILAYIEGVKDGARFMDVAMSATRKKPVIVLKAGVTEAGAKAASSHTGAIAGSDIAYEAAFRRSNVIRARSMEELFDLARALDSQNVPRGSNVAIVTNAGGPGILAADACERYGLHMVSLDANTIATLGQGLPQAASLHNPVDVLGDAGAERYRFALENTISDPYVNSVLAILTPQAMTDPAEVAAAVVEVSKSHSDKPLVASFIGGEDVKEAHSILTRVGIPDFPYPERAVYSLKTMWDYSSYLKKPVEFQPPIFEVEKRRVQEIFAELEREDRVNLYSNEALAVVEVYGVKTPKSRIANNKGEAVKVAEEVGFPVVMKIASPEILHKTDIGCVKLGVGGPEEVERNFDEMVSNCMHYAPRAKILGVEIQEMAKLGREVIVGLSRDPQFGPLMMFGLGGIYVDFLKDVSFRLCPVTREEAQRMVEETKAYTLLRGIRGESPSDIEAIVDVILRVSQLVTDFKEVCEMDINPLFVYKKGEGCLALDVKITLGRKLREGELHD